MWHEHIRTHIYYIPHNMMLSTYFIYHRCDFFKGIFTCTYLYIYIDRWTNWQIQEETNNFNATNHSTSVNDILIKHWANRQLNIVRWTSEYFFHSSCTFLPKQDVPNTYKTSDSIHGLNTSGWRPVLCWGAKKNVRLRWRDFQNPGFAPKNHWRLNLWTLDLQGSCYNLQGSWNS